MELARVRLKVKGQREEWYIPLNIIHIRLIICRIIHPVDFLSRIFEFQRDKMLLPMLRAFFLLSTCLELASPMLNTKLLKSTVKKANAALKSFDDMKLDWQPKKAEGRMGEKHPGFGFARIPSKSSLLASKRANVLEMATKDLMAGTPGRVKRQTVERVKAEFGSPFQLEVNAALLDAEDEDGCPEESRKCLELDLSFRTLTGRCNSFTFPGTTPSSSCLNKCCINNQHCFFLSELLCLRFWSSPAAAAATSPSSICRW